ncbi:uracil-xanthine permease family protein [Petroclostridium sp. X23]|uniref:uracil-xanthine permease family protein n=1 Tax=Petroclostridium sp. X23 TaxID=3045146 RepID=UPI0024AD68D5|nr:uracil-xanthine permease family protein [Petroclostridium sp. X23]WHH59541.1 uracil-xanthine permease family protein [Petroclostridium sp. X23]
MSNSAKSYILGLQHLFAMFGATVLVPALTGLNPAVALFTAGLGTLAFHFVTGKKVPVFLGSSFAFIPVIQAVIIDKNPQYIPLAQGGIIAAGFVYILLSALVALVGVDKIRSFFPPIVTGPIIMVIGLTLSPTAVSMASGNWYVAIFVLVVVIAVTVFDKGFFKLVPILIGIASGYVLSLIFDYAGWSGETPLVNIQAIHDAPLFYFNDIVNGKFFTVPTFDWSVILLIAPVAFVTFMEHIGDITTNGAVVQKDFFKDPGMHRTILGDGLATLIAGTFGGPANTTYSENTGVLAVTKVYDPRILRIAAVYAIILSMVGKLGAVLQTIPVPVMGGVSLVLFGMIASIGMRTISEAELDFTHSRNLIIVSLILVVGLGVGNVQITQSFSASGLFLATVVGVFANKVLPKDV